MSPTSDSQNSSPQTYEPVSPVDIVRGHRNSSMASTPLPTRVSDDRSSSDSVAAPMKSPRSARFAEATTVHSPTVPTESGRSPFADPPSQSQNPGDVSDVGFGYVNANDPVQHMPHHQPPTSPLKSALKLPGTPGRTLNPLSPTFREEFYLEKQERSAEKDNEKDLRIKLRVRVAKIFLRCVSFGCSLIILCILATTLFIFHKTINLPSRSGTTPWAVGTNPWPQYLMLATASLSLIACIAVFWGWKKGGHKRAEKVAVYYSIFSVCFFVFSLILWVVSAAIYQNSKSNGGGKDIWGWSCKNNFREEAYKNDIDYALLCRLQDWGLICAVIEVVLEILVILIYAVTFYRIWTKRRLGKSMDRRDKARSDLYLAQLRLQSAPNTPGFPRTPKSPYVSTGAVQDSFSAAEKGEYFAPQFATPRSPTRPQPTFQLQPPPIRVQNATPKTEQGEFSAPSAPPQSPPLEHMGAAPGERTYEAVPIPGAYASPMTPSFPQGVRQ